MAIEVILATLFCYLFQTSSIVTVYMPIFFFQKIYFIWSKESQDSFPTAKNIVINQLEYLKSLWIDEIVKHYYHLSQEPSLN